MYIRSKKLEAIKLRNEGYSYSLISSKLGIAKSTLSLWLKGVSFCQNNYTKDLIIQGQKKSIEGKRLDKILSIMTAVKYAEKNIGKMSGRDIFLLGIGIYIGEGSKAGNLVRIVNSDPRIIKFSIQWFKNCFGLNESNFKIRIHMYPDNNEDKVLTFWRNELNLPKETFHTPYIDRRLNKKSKKTNILPYGTAHLSVVSNGVKNNGVLLHRKILASINFVLK